MLAGSYKAPPRYNLHKLCNTETLQPNAILSSNSVLCQQPKQPDWAHKKMRTLRHCPCHCRLHESMFQPLHSSYLDTCILCSALLLLYHHHSSKVATLIAPYRFLALFNRLELEGRLPPMHLAPTPMVATKLGRRKPARRLGSYIESTNRKEQQAWACTGKNKTLHTMQQKINAGTTQAYQQQPNKVLE